MKNFTKILGTVLAVIMICNVFAIGTLAAPAEGGAIKLMLSTDKDTYAPGEEVVITFSEQVVAAVGSVRASGQYEIAYNNAVLQPLNDKVKVSEYGGFTDLAGDAAIDNCKILFANACVGNGSSILDSDVAAYGWNEQIGVLYMHSDGTEFDATTSALNLFTLKMKISETAAAGTYTIGFNQGGYEGYSAYSNDVAMGGVYGYADDLGYGTPTNYDCGVVTFTVAGGTTPPPAATVTVNNLSTQVQWANKDAGLMNLGFRGQIAEGYDATADDAGTTGPNGGKNLAKLTEVGFYLNGTKYQSYTIYNFVTGGYFYRVVVGNVSYDSETEFSAQAYVVINGTEYRAADATTITTTGKAQYERAKDAMGAK